MDAVVKKKENVCNPMDLMNTIGRELQEIFELSSIKDGESRLGIKDLASKERLNEKQIDKVCEILGRGDEMKDFIRSFQDNYELQKAKAKESYAQSKKNFTKLKMVLPLLRNEFNDGNDRLDDIIDYFGVDSEEEIFEEGKGEGVETFEIIGIEGADDCAEIEASADAGAPGINFRFRIFGAGGVPEGDSVIGAEVITGVLEMGAET